MSKDRKRAFMILVAFFSIIVILAISIDILQEPIDALGNVGPWYSQEFLEENPQYKSDMGR